jgi:hypothetical protein
VKKDANGNGKFKTPHKENGLNGTKEGAKPAIVKGMKIIMD